MYTVVAAHSLISMLPFLATFLFFLVVRVRGSLALSSIPDSSTTTSVRGIKVREDVLFYFEQIKCPRNYVLHRSVPSRNSV